MGADENAGARKSGDAKSQYTRQLRDQIIQSGRDAKIPMCPVRQDYRGQDQDQDRSRDLLLADRPSCAVASPSADRMRCRGSSDPMVPEEASVHNAGQGG